MRDFEVSYEKETDQIEVIYKDFGGPTWHLYINETHSSSYYVYDEYDNDEADTIHGDFKQLLANAREGFFDIAEIISIMKKHSDIHPEFD